MITSGDIEKAAERIRGRVLRTPLRRSEWLSRASGTDVLLKLESLQQTFSYKIRGATNAVMRLAEQHTSGAPPLVTASAGNHGRALATAAMQAGMRLTVYVPEHAPRTKLDAIRDTGADLRPCRDYDEAERRAKEHAATGDAVFISPYSHPDVIAGAGTVALEILEERPDVASIIVPIGGGGLISGIALAARSIAGAGTSVLGVEVEASQPFTRGRAAGRIVPIEVGQTLADGLAGNLDPDTVTFDIVQRLVSRIAVVAEPELRGAMSGLLLEERLVVEGAGAVGVAALISRKVVPDDGPVAVVISGANVDPGVLRSLVQAPCA
jgi:threonine dehydratase